MYPLTPNHLFLFLNCFSAVHSLVTCAVLKSPGCVFAPRFPRAPLSSCPASLVFRIRWRGWGGGRRAGGGGGGGARLLTCSVATLKGSWRQMQQQQAQQLPQNFLNTLQMASSGWRIFWQTASNFGGE